MEAEQLEQATMKLAQEALKMAKITMMMAKDTSFYTTILFSLKQVITNEIPTAATNGKHLLINPKFFIDLPTYERITLLAHEVLHVALDHMHRCGDRNPQDWNVAGDYVINAALVKAGYSLPKGGLYDRQYEDMSTEQVYNIIRQKSEEQRQNLFNQCGGGDVQYPDQSSNKQQVSQEEVNEIIMRAKNQAQAMGQFTGLLPAEIELELQKRISPKLPWHKILANYLTEFAKNNYSFKRANKRFMPDLYLPTAYSEAICNLAVCVDISSSVEDYQFNDFICKIDHIRQTMKPERIDIMAFNTRFVSEQTLTKDDNPFKKLKFVGRGGTAIEPVHKWLAEKKPTVAIIFTDGQFRQTKPINKKIPVIWLIFDNKEWKSKYGGKVIHFDIPEY